MQGIKCRIDNVMYRISTEQNVRSFGTEVEEIYQDTVNGQQIDAPLQHPHHRGCQL